MYKIYKDKYRVYSDGRIFSLNRKRFMKGCPDKDGYLQVGVLGKTKHIHRLIAECFLPNYYGLPTVDHKDQNKTNNNLFNLKWETHCRQAHNRRLHKANKTGVTGVSFHKRDKVYEARFKLIEKGLYLKKYCKTKEEAIEQRLKWEKEYLNKE